MTPALAVATAVAFVWLGMVLAISFLETPLKFQAPDVTVRIGLGIGRLVFRALNYVELALAVTLTVAVLLGEAGSGVVTAALAADSVLVVQLTAVRPRLTRRSNRILAGHDEPRSRVHYAYVALEVLKVVALCTTGVLLLAT